MWIKPICTMWRLFQCTITVRAICLTVCLTIIRKHAWLMFAEFPIGLHTFYLLTNEEVSFNNLFELLWWWWKLKKRSCILVGTEGEGMARSDGRSCFSLKKEEEAQAKKQEKQRPRTEKQDVEMDSLNQVVTMESCILSFSSEDAADSDVEGTVFPLAPKQGRKIILAPSVLWSYKDQLRSCSSDYCPIVQASGQKIGNNVGKLVGHQMS